MNTWGCAGLVEAVAAAFRAGPAAYAALAALCAYLKRMRADQELASGILPESHLLKCTDDLNLNYT